jgi:hypothetical protein
MAYSPCPQCQNSKQFDALFRKGSERKAFDASGFLVLKAGGTLHCNKTDTHIYDNKAEADEALKKAGYNQ